MNGHDEDELVKVAYARDQAEAEFLQGLLKTEGVESIAQRAPGFDVPDFLAAGPRDVLVAARDVQTARALLTLGEDDGTTHDPDAGDAAEAPAATPAPVDPRPADRSRRVFAFVLLAAAIAAGVICVVLDVAGVL
jgi:hypothetical protein